MLGGTVGGEIGNVYRWRNCTYSIGEEKRYTILRIIFGSNSNTKITNGKARVRTWGGREEREEVGEEREEVGEEREEVEEEREEVGEGVINPACN